MSPKRSPSLLVRALHTASNASLRTLVAESKESTLLSESSLVKYPRAAILPQRSHDSLASTVSFMPEKRICQLPPKRHSRIFRNIRYTIFSIYRRLFTMIVVGNMIALLFLMLKYNNIFHIPLRHLSTAVSANLFLSVLIRQELAINLLFTVFGYCPKWFPLRVRRLLAKVYHFGGIHSGCGISATLWFSVFHAFLIREVIIAPSETPTQSAALALTAIIDFLLVSICVTAYPRFRILFHDSFEMIHRFVGWTAILLFWAQLMVLMDFERRSLPGQPSLGSMLVVNPSFWLLLAVSVFIIAPWLQLRQVGVHPEFLSDHAIRLHFTYTNLALCCAPRFSDRPLREWHAFAGIPARTGSGFSIVVSNAGDWTKRIIQDPPTHLWTRGFPTKGVLNIAQIFNSVVLVATGSGIGPILSLISARNIPCHIVWSTPTPETTYQLSIVDDVYRADPSAIIIDTTRFGRPDLVRVSYEAYKEFNAEAVFIISNPKVTRKVVYGLETREVPIFAPIFDS